jgi:hypothetical protein
VIGVNFGVFTENSAANMAIPIRFAIELLKRSGWESAEEGIKKPEDTAVTSTSSSNTATTKSN